MGWVAIGRNEGQRLVTCLQALQAHGGGPITYVDSGSTDGSVAFAHQIGAEPVALDMSIPFTAARSRNAGFGALTARCPGLRYVHFIDGDCEILPGWLARAQAFLDANPQVAAVAGRVFERHPEASIYNQLCQYDWDAQGRFGEVEGCGGIVLMRVEAFREVEGFDAALIAGEEPELCIRLRARGWKIWRLDAPMCLHDASMTRFSQWWRRVERSGHAFAEGYAMHGGPPFHHWRANVRRAWLWGGALPALIVAATLALGWKALALLLIYPLQALRLSLRPSGDDPWTLRCLYSVFVVLARFAEFKGVLRYRWHRFIGQRSQLIEYK